MSQREVSAILGRENAMLGRIELGERRLDVIEYFWIVRAIGADPAKEIPKLMREFAKLEDNQ